jgi:hypothetical protein
MGESLWQVQDGERVLGPYREQQVLESIARGLPATAKVRRVGAELWMPIGAREPFASAFRTASAAPEEERPAGVPIPRGRRPLMQDPVALVGVGMLGFAALAAIVLVIARSGDSKTPARSPAAASTVAVEPAVDSGRLLAEAKVDEAAKIWYAYTTLPAEKQNMATWKDALTESMSKGADLRPPHDEMFRRENMGLARKFGVMLVSAESRATGPNFAVFVPSSDYAKCVVWAAEWLRDGSESLRNFGFTRVRCEGTEYKSKVTGNMIRDPDREWPVP